MIRVRFRPDALDEQLGSQFAGWCARADTALAKTVKSVDDGNEPDVESRAAIWRDHKTWLLREVFHHKCAYCEGGLAAQTKGAAEHYRPKKGVAQVDEDGRVTQEQHTGYWWLAFTWENLVPACPDCNTSKGVKFPITGTRVASHEPPRAIDELDAVEQPLLLHPFRGPDPEERIGFRPDGWAFAKIKDDPWAAATLRDCDLNRWGLRKDRRRHQREAVKAFILALSIEQAGGPSVEDAMADYESPAEVYSRAVADGLDSHIERILTPILRRRHGANSQP